MNNQEFEIEFNKAVDRSKQTLISKAKEYAQGNNDRLNQFYRAGEVQCVPPTAALVGMMIKHVTSICDMVKEPSKYKLSMWDEKIGDLRNYSFLLDALVRDMRNKLEDKPEVDDKVDNEIKSKDSNLISTQEEIAAKWRNHNKA